MVGEGAGGQPVPPEGDGRLDVLVRLVLDRRGGASPRHGNEALLAFVEAGASIASSPGDAQPEAAHHRQLQLSVRSLHHDGPVALPVVVPPTGLRSVVEHRCAHGVDLDPSGEAPGSAQQDTGGGLVGGRPSIVGATLPAFNLTDHQEILDDKPPGGCVPGRLEHHRARHVAALVGNEGVRGPEAEGASRAVEQGAEDTGRVRSGQAQPFDRSVGCDQTIVFAVGEECVVGDRREVAHIPCFLAWERSGINCDIRHLDKDAAGSKSTLEASVSSGSRSTQSIRWAQCQVFRP